MSVATQRASRLREDVRACLDEVVDPCSVAAGTPIGLDGMGLIRELDVSDGHVRVDVRLTSPSCHMHGYFIDEIERRVGGLGGVDSVEVAFDEGMDWDPGMMREDVRRRRREQLRRQAEAFMADERRR